MSSSIAFDKNRPPSIHKHSPLPLDEIYQDSSADHVNKYFWPRGRHTVSPAPVRPLPGPSFSGLGCVNRTAEQSLQRMREESKKTDAGKVAILPHPLPRRHSHPADRNHPLYNSNHPFVEEVVARKTQTHSGSISGGVNVVLSVFSELFRAAIYEDLGGPSGGISPIQFWALIGAGVGDPGRGGRGEVRKTVARSGAAAAGTGALTAAAPAMLAIGDIGMVTTAPVAAAATTGAAAVAGTAVDFFSDLIMQHFADAGFAAAARVGTASLNRGDDAGAVKKAVVDILGKQDEDLTIGIREVVLERICDEVVRGTQTLKPLEYKRVAKALAKSLWEGGQLQAVVGSSCRGDFF